MPRMLFLCLNGIFPPLVPPRGYFFATICYTSRFRLQTGAEGEATAATPPPRPLCNPEVQVRRTIRSLHSLVYIFVRQGFSLYSAGSPGSEHLFNPGGFSRCKLHTRRGDQLTVLHPI